MENDLYDSVLRELIIAAKPRGTVEFDLTIPQPGLQTQNQDHPSVHCNSLLRYQVRTARRLRILFSFGASPVDFIEHLFSGNCVEFAMIECVQTVFGLASPKVVKMC